MTIGMGQFKEQVDNLITAGDDELGDTARADRIKAALERYGHDRPDELVADVTGDGGRYYEITTTALPGWSEGTSSVLDIQYPAPTIASDEMPLYLEPEDWDDGYLAAGKRYLYLPHHAPAATQTMRITYAAPYAWTNGAVDIPPADFHAVCHLAAGYCCQAIAARYSRTSDPSIAADSVAHTSRAAEFAKRAKEFIGMYETHLGLAGGGAQGGAAQVKAAGTFVDWDTGPGYPAGRDFLFHGRGLR